MNPELYSFSKNIDFERITPSQKQRFLSQKLIVPETSISKFSEKDKENFNTEESFYSSKEQVLEVKLPPTNCKKKPGDKLTAGKRRGKQTESKENKPYIYSLENHKNVYEQFGNQYKAGKKTKKNDRLFTFGSNMTLAAKNNHESSP